MIPLLLVLGLLPFSCGESQDDDTATSTSLDGGSTTDGGGGDGGAKVDCWTLDPEACAAAGCQAIRAREVIPDGKGGWCVDLDLSFQELGCMPADSDCGAVNRYATAPTQPDGCFQFPSACIVPGWQDCADPAMTNPEVCP